MDPLPGPHEEVKVGIEIIINGLKGGLDKEKLATALSERYVELLRKLHHKGDLPDWKSEDV